MNRDPINPDPGPFGPLPAGLTEADLLDWVEQRLPAGRAGAIEIAIRANPSIASRLEEMRVDRAAVASLPELPAPTALLDAVERTLERQMLVGLATGDALTDLPPVSLVRPPRRSRWSIGPIRGDAIGRHLALAAAVALVVGGAGLLGILALQLTGRSTLPVQTASGTSKSNADPAVPTPTDSPTVLNQGTEIATTAGSEQPPAESVVPAEPEAITPAMTLARAVDLAREGRLIVRVRSSDLSRTLLRFGRIAGEPRNAWRLGEDAPGQVVAGLQTEPPRMIDPAIEPTLADWVDPGLPGSPLFPIPTVVIPRVEVQRIIPTVFLAQVRDDDDSLKGLLAALDATTIHSAIFEEAAAPIPVTPPALDADAMLWWTLDPSGWRPWTSVPVVVEQRK